MQTIGKMITKTLTRKVEMCPLYIAVAAYAVSTLGSPALSDLSPVKLAFVCKPPD